MKILITGCAGFIGAATVQALLESDSDATVIGIDNLNDYYDVSLKQARLERLTTHKNFQFYQIDLKDSAQIMELFNKHRPQRVINLAAQAGVRYSLERPDLYVESNLVGFCNILEGCRAAEVEHLVFASSSSVYGANCNFPYAVTQAVDHPLSLYAATKKSNELLAHSYSHLFGIPVTGLRYFTVYGPWGRPDMAPMKFIQQILKGETITVHNHGNHQRDFTYIDDIVEGTLRVLAKPPQANPAWDATAADPSTSHAPYRIFNIGNGRPIELLRFIELLEDALGRKAVKKMVDKQPGDVDVTWADVDGLAAVTGYKPQVKLEEGIPKLVKWYRTFYYD